MPDVYPSVVYDADSNLPEGTKIAVRTTTSDEVVQVVTLGDLEGNVAVFTDGKLEVTS